MLSVFYQFIEGECNIYNKLYMINPKIDIWGSIGCFNAFGTEGIWLGAQGLCAESTFFIVVVGGKFGSFGSPQHVHLAKILQEQFVSGADFHCDIFFAHVFLFFLRLYYLRISTESTWRESSSNVFSLSFYWTDSQMPWFLLTISQLKIYLGS